MNAPFRRTPPRNASPRLPGRALGAIQERLRRMTDHEDKEFLPAALEIRDTPASPFATGFVWLVAAGLAAAILWSSLARLDIFAVASGRVQVSGRSKVVQAFDTGKVRAVLVQNGSAVKAGDMLVELDPAEAEADLEGRRAQLEAADAEIARREVQIGALETQGPPAQPAFPPTVGPAVRQRELAALKAELGQYTATRESLRAQIAERSAQAERFTSSIAARQRLMAVLRERATMRETLAAKSAGTRAAVIDAVQLVEQNSADLAYDQGQLVEVRAAATSLERKLDQLMQETIATQVQKLGEAAQKRDTLRQDVIKATLKLERTRVLAPLDGTVQQLAITTLGQVVAAGAALLVVVPSGGSIEIEALVQNKDIGFVSVGQHATVKVDAFPFTRYGTLDGTVVRVSRDAVDERDASGSSDTLSVARGGGVSPVSGTPRTQNLVFPVTVELVRDVIPTESGDVRLSAGMTTNVEIRTGSRRVIDYVLAPIRETVSQAGHER
ncbi:MAG: type secretion rane fusion protein HlyD family [Enterovirga sp.]|nr:type secretion rane fusion protein HlyD family [Enterovirga sp.]